MMTCTGTHRSHPDEGRAADALQAGEPVTIGDLTIRMVDDRLELRRPGQLSRFTLDELEIALSAARSGDDDTRAA